jgi:hypothetical protein
MISLFLLHMTYLKLNPVFFEWTSHKTQQGAHLSAHHNNMVDLKGGWVNRFGLAQDSRKTIF